MRRALPRIILAGALIAALLFSVFYAHSSAGGLRVLCSNNASSCEALAEAYERHSGHPVFIRHFPTSRALSLIEGGHASESFDVWVGGPAEAYVQAEQRGLLLPHNLSPASINPRYYSDYWIGTYGGVLALCTRNDGRDSRDGGDSAAPASWEDLLDPRYRGRIAVPSPISSGTAATFLLTQHERLKDPARVTKYLRDLDANVSTYTNSGTKLASLVQQGRVDVAITFAPYCTATSGSSLRVTYPLDGVGFEIGASALLAGGGHPQAQEFLSFAISDQAQRLVASIEHQNPTSTSLPNNLDTALAAISAPIFGANVAASSAVRAQLIDSFVKDVLYAR